jgi:SGNH hydrolase-like domain, acetyltransferase AlgX
VIRALGTRFALVVAGLLAPLLLIELALRLFGPILPGTYNTGSFLTTHPVYGRFHVLGFDGWVKTAEYTSRVTINSLGLRGPERPFDKPPGTHRILMLGDSFVEAAQVSERDGVASRLEAALNATQTGRYEVLNAGVGGWGTGQQSIYLEAEGHRYQPDLVLVALYLGNDIYDNSYTLQGRPRNPHEPYFVLEDDGSLRQLDFRLRKPEEIDPLVAQLRAHALLWNVVETGVLTKFADEGDDPPEVRLNRFNLNKMLLHGVELNERALDAWKVTLALLERTRRLADQHGAQTAVVAIPAAWQVLDEEWDDLIRANKLRPAAWSPDAPNDFLAARGREIGAPILDLLPALRREAASTDARLYFPLDKHWTAHAHAVAARELAAFLTQTGLVTATSARR